MYILSRDITNVIVMRTDNYLSVGVEGTWENVEMRNRYYANFVKNYAEQSATKRRWGRLSE